MLSSLGFDSKDSTRSIRNGPSKYFEVPRGFSVHVFKTPTTSTHTYNASGKFDTAHRRPSGVVWSKPSEHPPRLGDSERKLSLTAPNHRTGIAHASIYEASFEPKSGKTPKRYGIYPSSAGDMYIYERSVSPTSDLLASSPSSSSSDSDILSESAVSASVEISSTRASSSTETLETTALSVRANVLNTVSPAPSAPSRSTSSSGPTRVIPPATTSIPPGLSPPSDARRVAAAPTFALPLQFTSVETVSDSDSDTVIDDPLMDILQPRPSSDPSPAAQSVKPARSLPIPPPTRRNSDERSSNEQVFHARNVADDQRNAPSSASSTKYRNESPHNLRAPPGLATTASATADGGDASRRVPSSISIPDAARQPQTASVSPPRSGVSTRQADYSSPPRNSKVNAYTAPSSRSGDAGTGPAISVPPAAPLSGPAMEGSNLAVATKRGVRWSDDLICPSPILCCERRKGWFNRRGDQLWTNDGRYKAPEAGQEYPPDLAGYPDFNEGWMNETGVRIDMEHRLVPLRSALKRPKSAQGNQ